MTPADAELPRLRQAVLVARDLEKTSAQLREVLCLGEPFSDPAVEHFGLRNAVFVLGDTFLEVVSPLRGDTAAGRLLERRGGDCGYMLMFQVEDLALAQRRARAHGVRAVFEVSLEDMAEVHLHPVDMRGAIVSLSEPRPPESWRWGGPGWVQRSVAWSVSGATIAVCDPAAVRRRWNEVIGGVPGVRFTADESERGLVEIAIKGSAAPELGEAHLPVQIGGVRLELAQRRPGHEAQRPR